MKLYKLLFTRYEDREAAFLLEDDRLIQVLLHDSSAYSIGDIYIGRVKNIIKGMEAAFIELMPGSVGFLPFSHINPKCILNRTDARELKCGDEVIVQIHKEPLKTKEAALTTDISFSGSGIVLIPYSKGIHYSQKLTADEKQSMRDIISGAIMDLFGDMDVFLQHYGLIVRTNARHMTGQEMTAELHELFHKAGDIVAVADKRTVFSCLYHEDSFYSGVIRNHFSLGQTEVVVDDKDVYERLMQETFFSPEISSCIRYYEDPRISLYKLYGLEEKINQALNKKVWLNCGAYLVIEPTEALTVIDVNSGKACHTNNRLSRDEFYHQINCAAVPEIVRQLRLRNISGIIVVDFLKTGEEYSHKLLSVLKAETLKDPVRTTVVDMTALGLVEMTRKKTEASLREKLKFISKEKETE